eukprot:CCRYP_001411-RC/>CCRYP_001411-RC protein AED:0.45 eAED:1.00 QI:0/0/0/1/0/0/2/0/243
MGFLLQYPFDLFMTAHHGYSERKRFNLHRFDVGSNLLPACLVGDVHHILKSKFPPTSPGKEIGMGRSLDAVFDRRAQVHLRYVAELSSRSTVARGENRVLCGHFAAVDGRAVGRAESFVMYEFDGVRCTTSTEELDTRRRRRLGCGESGGSSGGRRFRRVSSAMATVKKNATRKEWTRHAHLQSSAMYNANSPTSRLGFVTARDSIHLSATDREQTCDCRHERYPTFDVSGYTSNKLKRIEIL